MLVGGLAPTDPNRFAVLAVRSMLAVLDDDVSATILRLNGSETTDIPITSLRSNRARLESLLSTEADGDIASYRGRSTHCIQGFDRLVQTFNAPTSPTHRVLSSPTVPVNRRESGPLRTFYRR